MDTPSLRGVAAQGTSMHPPIDSSAVEGLSIPHPIDDGSIASESGGRGSIGDAPIHRELFRRKHRRWTRPSISSAAEGLSIPHSIDDGSMASESAGGGSSSRQIVRPPPCVASSGDGLAYRYRLSAHVDCSAPIAISSAASSRSCALSARSGEEASAACVTCRCARPSHRYVERRDEIPHAA